MTLLFLKANLKELSDTVNSINLYNKVTSKDVSPLTCYQGDTKESLLEIVHDVWSVKAKINMSTDLKTKVVYLSCLCTIMVASCEKWLVNFKDLPKRPRDFYMDAFENVLRNKDACYIVKPLLCRYLNFNTLLINLHSTHPSLVPSNIAYMNVEGFMHEHIEDQLFVIMKMRTFTKANLLKAYGAVKSTVLETRKRDRQTFVERSLTLGKVVKVQDMTERAFNECILVKDMEGVAVDDELTKYQGMFD